MNRSPDLDLRLATALDDVIADRAFDGPPLEIAGESLVSRETLAQMMACPRTDEESAKQSGPSRRTGDARRRINRLKPIASAAVAASDDSEDALDESSENK